MELNTIHRDDKIVPVLVAQAQGERVDSDVLANADKLIKDLTVDPCPQNRYLISQLIGYTVTELVKPQVDFLNSIADTKRVALGDKAEFKIKLDNIRAFVQAKGSTTPRSKIANKTVILDTVAVSARPVINTVELNTGRVQMSDLIAEAAREMEAAELAHIRQVLENGYLTLATPYYAAGSGLVAATLNPMIRHWMRYGGAALVGDIEVTSKVAELTGFAASNTAKQYASGIITEQNENGFIGKYLGAQVVTMANPYVTGSDTETVLDPAKLFILPTGLAADARPLKVVFEGDVQSMEANNIDDKSFEVRLDQYFGAGLVYGDHPNMSIYQDTSIV